MPSNYSGKPGNVTTDGPIVITGTTGNGVSPVTVTVSGSLPADFFTGAGPKVDITDVQGNTAANGQWTATPTGASTFTIPQTGNGTYAGGGLVQGLYLKSLYTVPSDGDPDNAASIFPSLGTLGDRTQFL